MRKKHSIAAAVLGMIVVLAMLALAPGCGNTVPSDAAATVNGVTITKDEVATRLSLAAGLNPSKVPTDPESEDYKVAQRDFSAQLVSEEIERQEAEKRNITVAPEEIDAQMAQIVEDKYLGSTQKMEEDFAKRGITDADLRNEVWRRLVHQKLLESLRDEVPVTDQEIQAQYDANLGKYVAPEKRQIRQIVVADQATAQSIANRIAAGEDFTAIAKQSSIDSNTRQNGGLLGIVSKDSLTPAAGDAAFALSAGQVSMPFKSDLGWYVVKVDFVSPAVNQSFDQVKEELRNFMSNQRLAQRYKEFTARIESEYDVNYADEYTPRPPSTPTTIDDASPTAPTQ